MKLIRSTIMIATVAALTVAASTADARRHHRGLGRLICGATQAAYFGHGSNLALDWAKDYPHTAAHPGAVVVQWRNGRDSAGHPGGHVSRIIRMTGTCSAIVADEKGQYERDICKRLVAYVDPNGNPATRSASADRQNYRHHRHHRNYAAVKYVTPIL